MLKIIKKNLFTLIIFEILYSTILTTVINPAINVAMGASIRVAGLRYLDQSHLWQFFLNPVSVIMMILVFFLIACFTLFNINAVNIIYLASANDRKIDLPSLLLNTTRSLDMVPRWHNISLYLYICLLLPLTAGILYENPILTTKSIPKFMIDTFQQYFVTRIGFAAVMIFLLGYAFSTIYVFLFILVNKCTFPVAVKHSKMLVSRTLPQLLKMIVVCTCVILAAVGITSLVKLGLYHTQLHIVRNFPFRLLTAFLLSINVLLIGLTDSFIRVFSMYSLNGIFFAHEHPGNLERFIGRSVTLPPWGKKTGQIMGFIILSVAIVSIFLSTNVTQTTVMAHRGGNPETAVENTEQAFLKAFREGVTAIELDVVETKDHRLVISHDKNLQRLTGVDKDIGELTLAQIKNLTIHQNGMEASFMSLDELLPLVPPTVMLNVEMKADDGNDKAIAEETEALLTHYPRHIVSSLSIEALQETKRLNPFRKTCLIMVVAAGNYEKLRDVDYFAIESGFVYETIVKTLHADGKKLFVWLVNSERIAQDYQEMGVDGIITDNPKEISDALYRQTIRGDLTVLKRLFRATGQPTEP